MRTSPYTGAYETESGKFPGRARPGCPGPGILPPTLQVNVLSQWPATPPLVVHWAGLGSHRSVLVLHHLQAPLQLVVGSQVGCTGQARSKTPT